MTNQGQVVAVIDMGKTNVKVSAANLDGNILESSSIANVVKAGPPWRHHDLVGLGDWIFSTLGETARRHPVRHVIAAGHGVGGILALDDPDAGAVGAALPMIDYEQSPPPEINERYIPLAGGFLDRGSAILAGSTHLARQALWMETRMPAEFARARWLLGLPQYWAWRLSGVAVSERSYLAAQSHLWNAIKADWSPIVATRGWQRLMPPLQSAWQVLGPIRPALARRYGIGADILVHAGAHDSTVNFYRYQAAGLQDFVVASTGTWIVGLADRVPLEQLDDGKGMTLNCDVEGTPLGGALVMGGREYALVAGQSNKAALGEADVDIANVMRLVEQGTMALPAFGDDDGQFPGSSGKGRVVGPAPRDDREKRALATLYCALLTVECVNLLGRDKQLVIDGAFLRNPGYAILVAALKPDTKVSFNAESDGVASGAALLCSHGTRHRPVPVELPEPAIPPGLEVRLCRYAARWRELAGNNAA